MPSMKKEKWAGIGILSACIFGAVGYMLLLLFGFGSILAVILASAAFFVFVGILGWIGWTIATTPAPKELEEITKELGNVPHENGETEEAKKDKGTST